MLAIGLITSVATIKVATYTLGKSLYLIKSISNMFSSQPPDDNKLLHLLLISDIKQKIAKTHKLLCELALLTSLKEYVLMSIKDLHEVIQHLNELFEEQLTLEHNHKQLYFSNWRSIDNKKKIDKIEIYIELFNIRFDDLLKMIQISHATCNLN